MLVVPNLAEAVEFTKDIASGERWPHVAHVDQEPVALARTRFLIPLAPLRAGVSLPTILVHGDPRRGCST
jgi:hypothetical protein